MTRWKLAFRCLLAAGAGALAAGATACEAVECGEGTIAVDGTCRPADEQPGNAQCGPGTKLGTGGKCIPERIVTCDPQTTTPMTDPATGNVTCVGSGTGGACDSDLQCTAPTSGMYTICGRLYDTQTDEPFTDGSGRADPCPATPTPTGPCSLKLTFVDALQFADNPATAPPLVPASFQLDTCGRYRAVDLPTSSFGYIGVAVDDANNTGAGDVRKLTGVALDQDDALPMTGFRTYTTRNETDTAWTTTSGITGGSFATRGVLAAVFRYHDAPRAGVTVRRVGQLIPNDDFYFSDTGVTRNTVEPSTSSRTATGPNGTALVINSAVDSHDGVGAEPPNCHWPASLAGAIAGVVFMQIKDAEGNGGPGAECP